MQWVARNGFLGAGLSKDSREAWTVPVAAPSSEADANRAAREFSSPRKRGRHMKLSLLVTSHSKGAGKVIPITFSQFLIGRDPQCQLRPASPVISKRHCALLVRGGKVFLRDFDSTNGTFINDQQVKG
jgi:hypothetical protein